MSKVITFSQRFPSHHVDAGKPTYFVEKFLNSLDIDYNSLTYLDLLIKLNPELPRGLLVSFYEVLYAFIDDKKKHTIRDGNRFISGEKFSPRIWSGKPYNSKQIIIAPDQVVKTFDIKFYPSELIFINNNKFTALQDLALNDGLTEIQLKKWFKFPINFHGQIICWDPTLEY